MNKLMSARNKKTKLAKKDAVTGFIFSMPSIVGMLVFFLIPFIICIALSLTDNINSMNFVGIDNYVDIISSQTFRLAAWNTLKFILVSVPLIMVFSFLIASLLYQKLKGFEFFRSVFVFPLVLPVSSVILFFQMIFAEKGLANDVLSLMGLPVKDWLNSSASFIVLVILYVWKNCGYNIILFLAALNSIPKAYYEVADLDSTSRFKKLINITLPMISPHLFFILIISIINTFKSFKEAYILCGDYPHKSIYMIQHFMNNNFQNLNYTRLSVGSILVFISSKKDWEILNMVKKFRFSYGKIISYIILSLLSVVVLMPVVFMICGSLMGKSEILNSFGNLITNDNTDSNFHIIPNQITLMGYADVFLLDPSYLMKFWISIFISVTIVVGQVIISCFSAYGLAKFNFPFKNVIFYLVVILMMLPVQVTLVPNYILFDKIGLIGSYLSLILPGIFSTFGVFLLTQVFSAIPNDMIEAAKIDGANHFQILCFIDSWNMIEQPLAFLKNYLKYPLSIFLSRINDTKLDIAFVCGVLAIIPVFILFLFFKDALIKGVEYSNMK